MRDNNNFNNLKRHFIDRAVNYLSNTLFVKLEPTNDDVKVLLKMTSTYAYNHI